MTVYSRQEKVDREGPLYDSLGKHNIGPEPTHLTSVYMPLARAGSRDHPWLKGSQEFRDQIALTVLALYHA